MLLEQVYSLCGKIANVGHWSVKKFPHINILVFTILLLYLFIEGFAPTSSHVNHQTFKNNKGVHLFIIGMHLLKQYGSSYSQFVVDK